jgi:PAS domain S-box-containing protein
MAPWRETIARFGFQSTASFPLKMGDAVFGVLVLYAAELEYFQEDELRLMVSVANNLSFAVEAQEREQVRAQTEVSLSQSEELLRMASRVGRLGAWVLDKASMAVTWSDALRAIHEVPPDYIPHADTGLAFYPPEFRPVITMALEDCLEHGTPFDLELQVITARGRRLWIRTIGEARRDADGQISGVHGAFQDISDRKQAEAESRQLAERLTTTIESLTEGFVTLDRDLNFTYVNAAAERLLHRTRLDLLGVMVWEGFPEARGSAFQDAFERAMTDQVMVQLEAYYAPLGGWFELRIYPSPQGLAIYFRDVSEPRRAREVLRISEERFRLLARATNDAVWDWDLATQALWWNEGFEALFGYARGEVQPTLEGWSSRIHPDDREQILALVNRVVDSGGETWAGEYRFQRKDGSYAYVLDRGYVLRDTDGKAIRMIGGMSDLTARKEVELRLAQQAALLDGAHDAILVKDLDDRIVYWNKGAEATYGWTGPEALGRRAADLLGIEEASERQATASLLQQGQWEGELVHHRRDGKPRTMDVRWTLVRGAAGQGATVLAINADVTERKLLESQFLRAQRMESLGTLAGGIAHDLNNVLAPILMSIDLLRMGDPDPRRQDLLTTVEASARRGAEMVRQVLTFARGVDGERTPVDPCSIARDVEKIIGDTFPKNITIQVSAPSDLWIVSGDATQLQQVLMNLCVNARDAMPEGGTLSIRLTNRVVDVGDAGLIPGAKPGAYVELSVSDSGGGIAPELMDRLFEPFFTTKELGKGTGLGLSIVHTIVRTHGGFVTVANEADHGARFTVYLPALLPSAATVIDAPIMTTPSRGHGELVLVIDDEAPIRRMVQRILESYGFRVILAANGAEGVSQYARHHAEIDLVLTDMAMPVMDGAATILALRAINPGVRIIASSGRMSVDAAGDSGVAGIEHVVSKPYTAETLLSTIHCVLLAT